MVICKYFQLGSCRFGQNCRFEHAYSSKYSYHAPAASTQQTIANTLTDEQLVNQVQSDIQAALKGGQWILSCYSPYKEKACFPGIADLSQEEARLIIYEAKASNTLDQAVNYMNNLFKETRQKYEQLLHPSAQIVNLLRRLYQGEPVTSPFGTGNQQSGFGSNATSLFRSAVQSDPFKSNTPFASTPSVFGQQPNNSVFSQQQTNNVFGQANNASSNAFGSNPQSIFSQASQNIFGQSQTSNVFQTQPANTAAKSIFAQANQSTFGQQQTNPPANVFATNQQPNVFATNQQPSVFGTNQKQDIFGATQQQTNVFAPNPQQQQNPFGIQQNPFGVQQNTTTNVFQQNDPFKMSGSNNVDVFGINKNTFQDKPTDDENVYSKIKYLSPSDLEAFNSTEFKLGFIPMVPPPHSLCI